MKSQRSKAWRNLMVAAINVGLDKKAISLTPEPEHPTERQFPQTIVEFEVASRKAIAHFSDIGFDEIAVHVMLDPNDKGKELIGCCNLTWSNCTRWAAAVATGWLERRNGKWLQDSGHNEFRSNIGAKEFLASLNIKARGYEDNGKFMF